MPPAGSGGPKQDKAFKDKGKEPLPEWLFVRFLDPNVPPETFQNALDEISTMIARGDGASKDELGRALTRIEGLFPHLKGSSRNDKKGNDDDVLDVGKEIKKMQRKSKKAMKRHLKKMKGEPTGGQDRDTSESPEPSDVDAYVKDLEEAGIIPKRPDIVVAERPLAAAGQSSKSAKAKSPDNQVGTDLSTGGAELEGHAQGQEKQDASTLRDNDEQDGDNAAVKSARSSEEKDNQRDVKHATGDNTAGGKNDQDDDQKQSHASADQVQGDKQHGLKIGVDEKGKARAEEAETSNAAINELMNSLPKLLRDFLRADVPLGFMTDDDKGPESDGVDTDASKTRKQYAKVDEKGEESVTVLNLACATMRENYLISLIRSMENHLLKYRAEAQKEEDVLKKDPYEAVRTTFGHLMDITAPDPVRPSDLTWLRAWRSLHDKELDSWLDHVRPGVVSVNPYKDKDEDVITEKLAENESPPEKVKTIKWIIELLYRARVEMMTENDDKWTAMSTLSAMRHILFNWEFARHETRFCGRTESETDGSSHLFPGRRAAQACSFFFFLRSLQILMNALEECQPEPKLYPDIQKREPDELDEILKEGGYTREDIAKLIKEWNTEPTSSISPIENPVAAEFFAAHPTASLSAPKRRSPAEHPLLELRARYAGVEGPTLVDLLFKKTRPRSYVSEDCWLHPKKWHELHSMLKEDVERLLQHPVLFPNPKEHDKFRKLAYVWKMNMKPPTEEEQMVILKEKVKHFIMHTVDIMDPKKDFLRKVQHGRPHINAAGYAANPWASFLAEGHPGVPNFQWGSKGEWPASKHIIPPGGVFLLQRWDMLIRKAYGNMTGSLYRKPRFWYTAGLRRTPAPHSVRQLWAPINDHYESMRAAYHDLSLDLSLAEHLDQLYLPAINKSALRKYSARSRGGIIPDSRLYVLPQPLGAICMQWPAFLREAENDKPFPFKGGLH